MNKTNKNQIDQVSSNTIIKMAKRLRIDLSKFGGIDSYKQGTWKTPLPDFIISLHEKRFGSRYPMP